MMGKAKMEMKFSLRFAYLNLKKLAKVLNIYGFNQLNPSSTLRDYLDLYSFLLSPFKNAKAGPSLPENPTLSTV